MGCMKEKILDILTEAHDKSDGHCGVYERQLELKTGFTIPQMKDALNELFKERKLTVHDGIKGTLVKLKV